MNHDVTPNPPKPIAWCVKCNTQEEVDPWLRGARFRCNNATMETFHVAAVIPRELKCWLRFESWLVSLTDSRWHPRVGICKGSAELYGMLLVVVTASSVLLATRVGWLAFVFAALVILDLLLYSTRAAFITQHPQAPLRSAAYGLIGFGLIASNFAALYLSIVRNDFDPNCLETIAALYFSFVTLATVGYGDIHPKAGATGAQLLVIVEVTVGLFYVAGVLVTLVAWANGRPGLPTLEQLKRRLTE